MLKEIEIRVDSLVRAFGGEVADAPSKSAKDPNVVTDEDLLNGPQLPTSAANQAEIDRLLASFD
jgi:chemotaxis protein CheZ